MFVLGPEQKHKGKHALHAACFTHPPRRASPFGEPDDRKHGCLKPNLHSNCPTTGRTEGISETSHSTTAHTASLARRSVAVVSAPTLWTLLLDPRIQLHINRCPPIFVGSSTRSVAVFVWRVLLHKPVALPRSCRPWGAEPPANPTPQIEYIWLAPWRHCPVYLRSCIPCSHGAQPHWAWVCLPHSRGVQSPTGDGPADLSSGLKCHCTG